MLHKLLVIKSSRFLEKAKQITGASCAMVLLSLSTSTLAAGTVGYQTQDVQVIPELMVNFITNEMTTAGINTTDLDFYPQKISQRLKLPNCKAPLDFYKEGSKTSFYGRNTIKVSCATPNWSFYSSVTVKAYGQVLTAASPISKDEIITQEHLQITRMDRSKITGNSLTDASSILGLSAKRPIRQGQILKAQQFEQPKLIERGDGVIIQAVGKAMTVSTAGEALSHGRLGENIRVRNIKSDREIIAKVKSKDTVVVMLY
ncbi:flagellar basal body P-ring formation chaperone FlgA [Litoribrevibacter albus]|nr:flagellar basal body P-ring formation chaperone FlgA [Litoribrevibacter albus]